MQCLVTVLGCLHLPLVAAVRLHYIRIPKSAGTLVWKELLASGCSEVIGVGQRLKRKSDYTDHPTVVIHENDYGVMLQELVGSEPTLAVMREPCERFLSLYIHLRYVDKGDIGKLTIDELLDYSAQVFAKCPDGDLVCKHSQLLKNYASAHRTFLLPQMYFVASRTRILCYSKDSLNSELNHAFGEICPCFHLSAASRENVATYNETLSASQCQRVKQIFIEDERGWSANCRRNNTEFGETKAGGIARTGCLRSNNNEKKAGAAASTTFLASTLSANVLSAMGDVRAAEVEKTLYATTVSPDEQPNANTISAKGTVKQWELWQWRDDQQSILKRLAMFGVGVTAGFVMKNCAASQICRAIEVLKPVAVTSPWAYGKVAMEDPSEYAAE
eukprot:TRINITY_DN54708_c0_g1_i1.p1 TRINITY_DN54708_c0_g1~~TRINITY_DN54708_c0_g1_i1.p1  ORF type:complete len:388 (+),score=36.99 TRINITY_DN54708_c0_g1_i1:86-1249(+)